MKVGFTGTHHGMTLGQQEAFRKLLCELDTIEFHHGDCIGADVQAHMIAMDYPIRIVVHPPTDPRSLANAVRDDQLENVLAMIEARIKK